ncbi:GNAT family N-acetyltransferase [Chryseobacterium sp. NKUCC03_KSP]|uniref:GNAT family N-acetyltransferase n=1 Tax=Chryseobacterium sp. NKUCC03_KSP TaxID=2842125 RepID=UPI001C5AF353|nr:GNAT family N-acetyltransferase [Chryseobacterium sp. NKUCC03_KSP]MBW3523872.1 GNAT family N-acetyltransferase [Chryseobacterium sp. NKUCC03_KSP]
MTESITYKTGIVPGIALIIDLYVDAGLSRPVEDLDKMEQMFALSNLIVTAWDNDVLIGISRTMTDGYWCYLADLAVRSDYQHKGIGRALINETKKQSGEDCMLLLLAAPTALSYYPKVGLRKLENAFALDRGK